VIDVQAIPADITKALRDNISDITAFLWYAEKWYVTALQNMKTFDFQSSTYDNQSNEKGDKEFRTG